MTETLIHYSPTFSKRGYNVGLLFWPYQVWLLKYKQTRGNNSCSGRTFWQNFKQYHHSLAIDICYVYPWNENTNTSELNDYFILEDLLMKHDLLTCSRKSIPIKGTKIFTCMITPWSYILSKSFMKFHLMLT